MKIEDLVKQIDNELMNPELILKKDIIAKKSIKDTGKRTQYIRFVIEKTQIIIPLKNAIETTRKIQITPLPNLPTWIMGIGNIRGEIISVINFKYFLELPETNTNIGKQDQIIIIQNKTIKTGIKVDKVLGLFTLNEDLVKIQTDPFKNTNKNLFSNYVTGAVNDNKQLLYIMDIDKLLSSEKMSLYNH